MAIPVVDLVNTTGSSITLNQLGLTIGALATLTAVTGTDGHVGVQELLQDPELHIKVDAGDITITVDSTALTSEQSIAYLIPHDDLEAIKHELAGTASPTVTDDDDAGYSVGSEWLDTTNDIVHFCIDASTGAAVWLSMLTSTGGGGFILGWGGSMGGTGKFMGAWQRAAGSEFSDIGFDTELTCPKAGTSSTLAWNSEEAFTDTIIKIHKNGILADTVTLDGVSGTVATIIVFAEADTIALEYDAGTAPKKSTWLLYVVP